MLPILICKRSAHIHFAQIAHYEENWKGGGEEHLWSWMNMIELSSFLYG